MGNYADSFYKLFKVLLRSRFAESTERAVNDFASNLYKEDTKYLYVIEFYQHE